MKRGAPGKVLEPTVEQITAALRCTDAPDTPDGLGCANKRCRYRDVDGACDITSMCFNAASLIDRLNDFDKTQSKIALERCQRVEAQLLESQRRERAAVELIGKVSQAVEVAFNATDYVKPNTGIWHTLGLALDWIKAWRGPQEAGKGETE